ncbi:MAG: rhodanese-like domain-containing protein [Burkholderiaceae bacterium]
MADGRPLLVFHVLGGNEHIPGALAAAAASEPGNFNDANQQAFADYLANVTRGDRAMRLAFYCAGIECWMSYNAALRAIAAGYTSVFWYRGGLQAWRDAGRPIAR